MAALHNLQKLWKFWQRDKRSQLDNKIYSSPKDISIEERTGWISSRNITQKFSTCIAYLRALGREVPRGKILIFSIWVWIVVSRVNCSEIWNFYNFNFSSWSRRPVRPLSSPRQVSLGKRDFELVSPASYARDRNPPPPPSDTFVLGSVRLFRHSSEKFNFLLHVVCKNRYPEKARLNESSLAKQELHSCGNCVRNVSNKIQSLYTIKLHENCSQVLSNVIIRENRRKKVLLSLILTFVYLCLLRISSNNSIYHSIRHNSNKSYKSSS